MEEAKYSYDSWGNIISITDGNNNDVSTNLEHIASINPFRYRSYYYDKETKLYYLNSRYYNPMWGRFINCDNVINSNQDILSHNLYIYCSNNPITNIDSTGFGILKIIKKVVKKVVKTVKKVIKKVSSVFSSNNKKRTTSSTSKKTTSSLPDYTKALDKAMVQNAAQASQMKKNSTGTGLLNYFYRQSEESGEWNYRVSDNWNRDTHVPFLGNNGEFLYHGEVITAEDFGNLNYGFVGASMGVDPTVLFIGGGFAKCGKTIKILIPPYYCDDENDHEMIQRGIDIYNNKR